MTSRPPNQARGPKDDVFPRSTPGQRATVLYLHLWIMGVAGVAGFGFRLQAQHSLAALWVASLMLTLLVVWVISSWIYLTTLKLSAYALWIFSCYAFHGGQPLLFLIGEMPFGLFGQELPVDLQVRSVCFTALCLSCAHLGALVALIRHGSRPQSHDRFPTERDLRVVGWTLLAVAVPGWSLTMARLLPGLFSYGYKASQQAVTGWAAAPVLLSVFCVPAAMLLVASGTDRPLQRRVAAFMLITNAFVWLMIGSRAEAVTPLLGLAWIWERRVRPLPRGPLLMVVVPLFLVVLPSIAILRNLPISERASLTSILRFARNLPSDYNPAFFIFQELGRTQSVLAYTMEAVPERLPYNYGEVYLRDLTIIFPNLFWTVHPAAVPSLGVRITELFKPLYTAAGMALGGTMFGEAYWSFGWCGCVLPFLLLGYGFAWLLIWAERSHGPGPSAAVAAFISYWLFAPRGHLVQVVRPLFWHAIMPYAAAVLLGRLRRVYGRDETASEEGNR